MALSDLRAKLAAVATAVKDSVATAATERIERARAHAAEKQARAEKVREQKYLLDALPGTKEEKQRRLEEIETAAAEYREVCKLLYDAETELLRAGKTASADRDQLVATAKAVVGEVRAEKERIEKDPDVAFFGWLRQLENMSENPDRRKVVEEINSAVAKGLLREITGERAREIQAVAKTAKEEGRQYEERYSPFFWVRIKPRGDTPQGELEPDDHFRYISGSVNFYERSTDGARRRLVFFAMQDLLKACTEAKKAAYEAAKEVRQNSYLTLSDIAAGKTGQAWAEITAEKPWEPRAFNRETNQVERLVKDGKPVVNYGPVVAESPRPGVLRVLNVVTSGMFHPLRLVGAWDENGQPVEFKFFAGNNPRTGQPNNFAGLKPVKDTVDLSPAKLGRLRAILCFAAGLQAPAKEEKVSGGASEASPAEGGVSTPRGYRSDGSKAGEARRGKGGKKGRRNADEEVPEVPRNVRSLADVAEE